MGVTRPDPDPDVIRRWQRGDPAAFAELVRAWQGPVGRFLARLTGSPHHAADLLQDTFAKVYQARSAYRDDGRFGPWVYRVALNLARDAARRAARHAPVPLTDHDPPSPANGDVLVASETAAHVTAALAALPDSLREVVVLRHYEELSFEDMGRLLGTPASTLKSRFAAAAKALAADLTARGLNPEDHP